MTFIRQYTFVAIFLLTGSLAEASVLSFFENPKKSGTTFSSSVCTVDSVIGNINICANVTFTLRAVVSDPNATVQWYKDSIGGIPYYTGDTLISDSTNFSKLFIEVLDQNNQICTSERKEIRLNIIPEGKLRLSVMSCSEETTDQIKVSWKPVDGAGRYVIGYNKNGSGAASEYPLTPGQTDTTIKELNPNQFYDFYVYAVKANTNCSDFNGEREYLRCKTVYDGVERDAPVPDAFTPNKDGINDDFGPNTKLGFTSYEMTIYNRYGGVIFNTKLKNQKWNGKYDNVNEDLPVGVYIYHLVITGLDKTDETKTYIGQVTLLR